jgi:glycosyltransferase
VLILVKVLSFCGDKIPSVVLGINNIFEYMNDKIDIEFTFKKTDMVKSKDIREADIVICVRGASDLDRDIVKLAKIYNRLIIYYLDDDLLNIPKYSGVSLFYENKQIRENMIYIMETSDILWTSNTNIRKKYGIYFERSYVMDIPINIQEIEKNNSKSDTENKDIVKICFAGSSDHIHMVDKMLSPVINNIAKKYSDQVYFYIIGVKPQKIKESNNVKIVEYFNNIQEYYDFVQKSGIDIGLAPLEASDFTACKYYNKFLDYTCNGMVGIYSDVEPYKLIVKSEFNGMLAKNEESSWEELLEKLILSKELREKIYFNAVKEVKEKFSYDYIMKKVLENIPEIKNQKKYKIKKRNLYLEKKVDLSSNFIVQRVANGFKIYGIKYLFIGSYKAVYKTLKYLKRKLDYAEEKK